MAGVGSAAPRARTEPVGVRTHPRGALLRRALLRHGTTERRSRAPRLARRRPLVEHMGHPPTTVLLPLRRGRRRSRASGARGAGSPAAADSRSGPDRRKPMTRAEARQATGARTGEQFLEGLREGGREIWLNGERISHPLDHPELRAAALSLARVYDVQHEHAEEMLAPSPDDGGRLVNVTHLIPRTREDLARRRRAFELVAAISGGTMGRTPDYLNVTFACFAGRSDVWARRGNEQGADNLVAYQAYMRDADLSTTHALINPQVDRSKPEAEQAAGQVALHKVGDCADAIVVRGAR